MQCWGMSHWCNVALGSLCLAGLFSIDIAHAETRQMPWQATPPPNVIEDKFRLDVGLWRANMDTSLRADSSATTLQPGTTLDGESDLGLAKSASIADIELTLLPGKRQLFRIGGFSSHRNSSTVLTQTVQYDGNTYLVGQTAKSLLNLDMLGMGYAYRVIKRPRFELDLGADVQIAHIEANVYVPVSGVREADAGSLPIPMLDGELRWEFWRRFELIGRYRWLSGSGNDGKARGAVRDWRYGVTWQFNQHLNAGLFQRHFGVDATVTSGSHPGAVSMQYAGWELALRASL
jgi:hypothetical protein